MKLYLLEDGLVEIDEYAFLRCTSLTEIHIPDSVTEICDHPIPAFAGCENLIIFYQPDTYAERYADAHDIVYNNSKYHYRMPSS